MQILALFIAPTDRHTHGMPNPFPVWFFLVLANSNTRASSLKDRTFWCVSSSTSSKQKWWENMSSFSGLRKIPAAIIMYTSSGMGCFLSVIFMLRCCVIVCNALHTSHDLIYTEMNYVGLPIQLELWIAENKGTIGLDSISPFQLLHLSQNLYFFTIVGVIQILLCKMLIYCVFVCFCAHKISHNIH